MDNLTKQIEEIEALSAIYGEEFQIEDEENRSYSVKITDDANSNTYIKLYFKFSDNYPLLSPPTFEISAPHLKQTEKMHITQLLESEYLSYLGQNVIFQWIEKIREEMQSSSVKLIVEPELDKNTIIENSNISTINEQTMHKCPDITHGDVILDRKSSFQGHAATVFSVNDVKEVLDELKENRKIQQATHNMYAFRIFNENNKNFIHDCDDDGEAQAGGRLLHLLEIMGVKNVIVVVSRWYGGIHLGPDRFRHINNAARQVLVKANLIPTNTR